MLLVEDNPVNQLVATRMLQLERCDVELAANGGEALERAQARTYDLILMDCHMPVMDGFEATRQLRVRLDAATRPPILALTATGSTAAPRSVALSAVALSRGRRYLPRSCWTVPSTPGGICTSAS